MTGTGILFGCALVLIVGVRAITKFMFEDPCEGDGTWRSPIPHYEYEDDGETEE